MEGSSQPREAKLGVGGPARGGQPGGPARGGQPGGASPGGPARGGQPGGGQPGGPSLGLLARGVLCRGVRIIIFLPLGRVYGPKLVFGLVSYSQPD